MDNVSNITTNSCFVGSSTYYVISIVFVIISSFINLNHIKSHLTNFTKPIEQKWIIRIIIIVPIYSILSLLCMITLKSGSYIYFQAIRDTYEAFIIYCYLCLFIEYLGGESDIISNISTKSVESNILLCTCIIPTGRFGLNHLRFCQRATLQFCIIKLLASIVTIILHALNLLHDGNFSPLYGYLYLTIIYNISYTIALIGFFFFYFMVKNLLSAYEPLFKFFTVKLIMFLSYWQHLLFIILSKTGHIKSCNTLTSVENSNGIIYFLLIFEMIIVACLLCKAFPYNSYVFFNLKLNHHPNEYSPNEQDRTYLSSIISVVDIRDIITDIHRNFNSVYSQYLSLRMNKKHENSTLDSSTIPYYS